VEPLKHRAGFVAIIGKPNAGKSTLMNRLVGERLSIITHKAQTTRQTIRGIVNDEHLQIVYHDTPGIIEPTYALQEAMMDELEFILIGSDIVLWMVDVRDEEAILPVIQRIGSSEERRMILLLNKIDLIADQQKVAEQIEKWRKNKKVVIEQIIPISAETGLHVDEVEKQVLAYLPTHPPFYNKDESFSDRTERFFAAEIVREQIFNHYHEEIPYSVEVGIESFQDLPNITHIHAVIYVEKQRQKAILIGKNGAALKKVGIMARQMLEKFLGRPIFLQQRVKVLPNWRHEKNTLRRLGYLTL
jgi:GTP-binding protein Era